MSEPSKAQQRAAKLAADRAAQAKRESRKRLLTIGGVVLAMVLIVGGAVLVSVVKGKKDEERAEKAAASAGGEYSLVIGPEDAPHTVTIYEDFLCPYCGALEAATHEELEELAADGKVRVEYRPFDLLSRGIGTDYPIRAANAFAVVLEEVGGTEAKEMHDLLFANQPSESGPFPTDDDLVDLAVEAGADEADVRPGIEGLAQQEWVDGATEAALEVVNGTPTVFIDGELATGYSDVEGLAELIISTVE